MTTPRQKREQKSYTDLLRAITANGGVECEQLPDVFFPEDSAWVVEQRQMKALAKEVCGRCPLMNQCAEYGLISNQTFGIWGGLTAQERELIRKK